MVSWDLDETYQLVRRLFGRDQERLVQESARSVRDRQSFSSYHFTEAMRLSEIFEKEHLSNVKTVLEIHAEGAEDIQKAFNDYMVRAGAHALAAVQSLHAIPDIFAHAVYFASGQNLQSYALKDCDISLQPVANCLKKDKRFSGLSKPLRAIQYGAGWKHVAAVSNMSKHRSVVRASYNEDWTGTRFKTRDLYVSAFEWHGKPYVAISLRDLLAPEYERLMKSVVYVANELNSHLRAAI